MRLQVVLRGRCNTGDSLLMLGVPMFVNIMAGKERLQYYECGSVTFCIFVPLSKVCKRFPASAAMYLLCCAWLIHCPVGLIIPPFWGSMCVLHLVEAGQKALTCLAGWETRWTNTTFLLVINPYSPAVGYSQCRVCTPRTCCRLYPTPTSPFTYAAKGF